MNRGNRNTVGRFAINAISSVLTTMISMTVLVWVSQYLLRRIPAEEYQLVPLVNSLLVVGEIMRNVFSGGLSRFMVEARAQGNLTEVTRIASSMLPVLAGGALLIAGLGALTVWRIDDVIAVEPTYFGDARLMLALFVLTLCLNLALSPFTMGLYVDMRFVQVNLIRLGTEVLRVILLLALLLGIGPQALWVVVASTVASLVNLALMTFYSWRVLPEARFERLLVSGATVRRLMRFSLWTSVQGFTQLANRMVPVFLLNHNASAVDVTAFYIGQLPDTQIRKLTTSAIRPAQPALTHIYATQGPAALQPFYYRGGRYHLWAALFLAAPLVAFAFPLIRLYVGETYQDAAWVLISILGVYPLTWASAMFFVVAYATGRIEAFNICSLVMSVLLLATLVVLVVWRGMGVVGAAWAFALAYGGSHLLLIWPLGLRLVKGRWSDFFRLSVLPGSAPFLVATTVCLIFAAAVPITTWGTFALGTGLSFVIYIAVLLLFCMDPTDRNLVGRMVTRVLSRLPSHGQNR